ncbi:hypothetical protein SDJN03_07367, partial [Cucurbita argyrosperma subsp. sororia]
MRFRVSPDDNRELPEQNPTAHHPPSVNGNHLPPIDPVKSEIATLTKLAIPYQICDGKAKSVLPLIPAKPDTAVTSTNSVEYRAGIGKVKSVIPKKRKLVKTMMYHCIKDFLKSLFRPPPKTHRRRPKPIIHD